jgi:hypothetical protein
MNEAKQAAQAAATDEWKGEKRQTYIHRQDIGCEAVIGSSPFQMAF